MLSLTLACAFLACAQPLPTTPDDGPLLAPVAADIKLSYICGNSFRIRNSSPDTVTVRYDVYGTTETGPVFLAGKPADVAYSETYFTTVHKGTVRIFLGTQLVQTKANGNKPACALPSDTVRPAVPISMNLPSDTSISVVGQGNPSFKYYRNVFAVAFTDSATGVHVNQLLQSFSGTIIGGVQMDDGDSYYIIRVADPGVLWDSVSSLEGRLGSAPGVRSALMVQVRGSIRVHGRYPVELPVAESADWWRTSSKVGTRPFVRINAPLAWGCENGMDGPNPRATIGLIDIGFSANPEFASQVTRIGPPDPSALVAAGPDVLMHLGHGTGIAGLIAADGTNGTQMAGMLWRSDLRLYSLGSISPPAQITSNEALQFIKDVKAAGSAGTQILATSLGVGDASSAAQVRDIRRALEQFLDRDSRRLFVYALGNDSFTLSLDQVSSGADAALRATDRAIAAMVQDVRYRDRILLVAAMDELGGTRLASANLWSDAGVVAAPGDTVVTVTGVDGLAFQSGSSFSAAFVTGLAGMLARFDPSLSGSEIVGLVRLGAREPRFNDSLNLLQPATDIGEMGVYPIDAYASLQLAARRSQVPICGTPVWGSGTTLLADRNGGAPELVANLGFEVGVLFPFHGGRKLVAQDALTWDAFVFERGQSGGWTQTGEWDGDDTELAGSGPAVFGYTHDRDSLGFVYGDRLYLGTRFLEFDRPFPLLPSRPNSQNGHAECIRKEKEGENWVCKSESFEGTTISYRWGTGAYPVGPRSIFLRNHVTSTESAISGVATDCATGGAPDENTTCLEWSGTSVETSLRSEVWRVDRVSEVAAQVTELAPDLEGRYVVSVTGSEDGGRVAVATEVYDHDQGGSVMGTDCRTDFYSYGTDGQLHKDATRAYAATCQPFDWQGGFGAARQLLTATRSPSTRGFGLRGRLLRATGR